MLKKCTWLLKKKERSIISSTLSMNLTIMEFKILTVFSQNFRQPMSHYSIAERIEKNPNTYKGADAGAECNTVIGLKVGPHGA